MFDLRRGRIGSWGLTDVVPGLEVGASFEAIGGVKQICAIRGQVVDLTNDAQENDEGSK